MNLLTAVCPSCRAKLVFKNKVDWKAGYIRCPSCKNRVYIELNKNRKSDKNFRKND